MVGVDKQHVEVVGDLGHGLRAARRWRRRCAASNAAAPVSTVQILARLALDARQILTMTRQLVSKIGCSRSQTEFHDGVGGGMQAGIVVVGVLT